MDSQARGNVIYMGNLGANTCSCIRSLSPSLLEVQPHGSGLLVENGANKPAPARIEGFVYGKRTVRELSDPGAGGKAYNLS